MIANPSNTATSDYELAQASSRGDMSAFEQIYERHHRRVYSLCLRMVANATEAEDLTQEVYIQLFRKIGSFRGESAFTTWLHRLTVNHVLMHFRKKGVKFEKTTEEGEIGEIQDLIQGGTERPRYVDRLALEKAIAELPPGYRTVFILHDIEGYENPDLSLPVFHFLYSIKQHEPFPFRRGARCAAQVALQHRSNAVHKR